MGQVFVYLHRDYMFTCRPRYWTDNIGW